MKITVQINNEPVEITLTSEQLAQIEAQKPPKKFKWEYKDSLLLGETCVSDSLYDGTDSSYIDHGRYRKSREAAELALLRNKRANRLEALAEQLGGLKEFAVFDDNCYLVFDMSSSRYNYHIATDIVHPEKVYMTQECAIEICRMLNEGEFSLDGEL